MAKLQLENHEREALAVHFKDPALTAAMKKFFAVQEQYFTEQSRNQLNADFTTLDQKARQEGLSVRYAATAKSYGQAWQELERVIDSASQPDKPNEG